jgi:hypothetical protein
MTHGGTSIAMRRRLWVRGYCVSPSWNVHVDCAGATCTGYTLFNMVRICGAPSTRYFIFNHMRAMRYLKHMRYSHRPITDPDARTSDRYGFARTARARACGTASTTENRVHPDRAPPVPRYRYTRTLVHASRSTYTRFRDQYPFHTYSRTRTPPRGDPTLTRDRGRSVTIQLTGASPVYHAVYTVQV